MSEPVELTSAREHLARAEATWRTADGLFHLEEALVLIDALATDERSQHRALARNVARAYATRIYSEISKGLERDRAVPEPELEHSFRIVLAFDQCELELPDTARAIKIEIARRLIDRYYEGHADEQKRTALEQLAQVTGEKKAGKPARSGRKK